MEREFRSRPQSWTTGRPWKVERQPSPGARRLAISVDQQTRATAEKWSGRWDSNPQPRAPKARAPPLRHAPTDFVLRKRRCLLNYAQKTSLQRSQRTIRFPSRGRAPPFVRTLGCAGPPEGWPRPPGRCGPVSPAFRLRSGSSPSSSPRDRRLHEGNRAGSNRRDAIYNRANADYEIGRLDLAIAAYTEAIDLDPAKANAFYSSALAEAQDTSRR